MASNATIRPQQIERAKKLLQNLPEKEDRKTRSEAAELLERDFKKAKEKGLNAHSIVSDKGLVSLATYKPSTLEEWLSLPGLGKQSYLNFAADYLKAKDG